MLEVNNYGSGFLGEPADWRIQYTSNNLVVGLDTGRLGSVSFNTMCDSTSKFVIDNYVSVQHYMDNQTSRWLSAFDGNFRSINTDGHFGQVGIVSLASALDGTRIAKSNPAGEHQREINLPAQVDYVANSVTYYTGGSFATVGGESVWRPADISIYDVTSDRENVYVLAAGGHSGEVVFVFGLDGQFRKIWPVWSDATDLASPQSRCISHAGGYIFIGQVAADRVKRFTVDGTFVNQWGSAGTGNGQFSTISDLDANDYGSQTVYVVDSAAGRIQYFTWTGTYTGQWGTSGTGDGNTVFNAPSGVTVEPNTGNVFVADINGRVREYSSTGTYVSQPMGSWTNANGNEGELPSGVPISVSFDSHGNAYALAGGVVRKYGRSNSGWPTIAELGNYRHIFQFDVGLGTQATKPTRIHIHYQTGIMHVPQSSIAVEQYSASLGCPEAFLLYYVALGKENFPVKFVEMPTWTANAYPMLPWSGNAWKMICDFCAALDISALMFDNALVFTRRNGRVYSLPHDTQISPLQLDSRVAGHDIVITNHNARYTVGEEIMYNSEYDERSISVKAGEIVEITVQQNSYPDYLRMPVPGIVASPGVYVVTDAEGDVVTPTQWTAVGGKIIAYPSDRPGSITIAIHGPTRELFGFTGPYSIEDENETPSLSILGRGIVTSPEEFTIGTGIPTRVTGREVAATINSPFCVTTKIAQTQGSWAAYVSGTPTQSVQFTVHISQTPLWEFGVGRVNGTAMLQNAIIEWEDAHYVVEEVEATAGTITLNCQRWTKTANSATGGDAGEPRFDNVWSGKTAWDFDGFWSGYTAQDVTIAPLRNPYGL